MTRVNLDHLTKIYPGQHEPALNDLSLEIASGELTALLGPSGCGKTTAMKIIAGLLTPTSGDVRFDGRSVMHEQPEKRGVVMVFQNHLLFPYMSVADNIGFGLKMRKADPAEINRRVAEMLELVQLPGFGARRPSALSGGQQQRVALARALIVRPDVLLLDEPLSNLDAHLRLEMRDLIRRLQQETGITTIFVTHDQEEAVVLADRVGLILDGELKQYDKPEAFYQRPADMVTARFFGGMNFVAGTSSGGSFESPLGRMRLPEGALSGNGLLTFRPENIRIGDHAADENRIETAVSDMIYLGTHTRMTLRVGEIEITALVNPEAANGLAVGDRLVASVPTTALWVLAG